MRVDLLACAALAAGLSLGAVAQEPTERLIEPPDYSDWYQIEVIIFAQNAPHPGDEAWAVRPLSYPDDMVRIAGGAPRPMLLAQLDDLSASPEGGEASTATGALPNDFLFGDRSRQATIDIMTERARQSTAEPGGDGEGEDEAAAEAAMADIDVGALFALDYPQSFQSVPAGERFLNRIAGSVRISSNYRMLDHLAWRQPMIEGNDWPILIQAGEQYGDAFELDGVLTFSRSRFLHVDADLWFTRFAEADTGPESSTLPEGITPEQARAFPELLAAARAEQRFLPIHTHRLDESRRMRREENHYIDHPYFGVIVRIERFDYEPTP